MLSMLVADRLCGEHTYALHASGWREAGGRLRCCAYAFQSTTYLKYQCFYNIRASQDVGVIKRESRPTAELLRTSSVATQRK